MSLSIFIAKLLSLVYVVIGVGFLFNKNHYRKLLEELSESIVGMFLGGMMALIIGFLIATYHNVWEMRWEVIITLLGWGSLVKGLMLLLAPQDMMKIMKIFLKIKHILTVGGIFVIVLGCVLGYFGFVAQV